MFSWKFPYIYAQFFFLSQWNRIVHGVWFFWFLLFDLNWRRYLSHWFGYFWRLIVSGDTSLIKVRFSNNFEVILLKLFSNSSEIRIALIESVAVPDDLVYICMELGWCCVLTCLKILLDFWQIHRLLNDFKIMRNSHCYWIHRLSKSPGCLTVLQQIQYFDARF